MKILIVDDSKAMRMIVKRTLCQAGYDNCITQEAANGREALSIIQQSPPDVVFIDWNMPEMSGMELIDEIKKNGVQLKYGFVTSEGTPDMRKRAEDAGALFFISKPFTVDSFQNVVAGILS